MKLQDTCSLNCGWYRDNRGKEGVADEGVPPHTGTGQAVRRTGTLLAEHAEVNLFLVSCRSYPQVRQEPEWPFSIYSLTLCGRWLSGGAQ